MNAPTRIRVGPLTYRVLWDAEEIRRAGQDVPGDGSVSAYSNHRRAIIALDPSEAPDVLRHSLLHEVLHCVLRLSGVWPDQHARDHVHSREPASIDVEEFVVAATAGPLLGVLRDNPDLLAYLTADEQPGDDTVAMP